MPGFELLPADVQEKLKALFEDKNIGWQERHEKIFEIMEGLPDEIKSKLPPPPGFEKLPQEVQDKLKAIHMDRSLSWAAKHQKVREIIDSLPEEVKRLLPVPPPPPGFELLPEEVKAQIKAVHENSTLGWREKTEKIREIMENLPEEHKRKLPFPPPPPGFEILPEDAKVKINAIRENSTLSWAEKHEKIREIIEALPEEMKNKLPVPPLPPGFELLPEDIKAKMKAVHEDKTLTHRERFDKIHEIMESLPADIKAKLPPPPPRPNLG